MPVLPPISVVRGNIEWNVIISNVFTDEGRYVFDLFDECLCRKHWLSMKPNTVIKLSWEAAISSRKYIRNRQVGVGVIVKSINAQNKHFPFNTPNSFCVCLESVNNYVSIPQISFNPTYIFIRPSWKFS